MKKAMTKRLLALVLALALCTALMLPGFAATKPTDSTNNNHIHTYVYGGKTETYEGGHKEAGFHMVVVRYIYVCTGTKSDGTKCGDRFTDVVDTIPVSHPNPCPTCGWGC